MVNSRFVQVLKHDIKIGVTLDIMTILETINQVALNSFFYCVSTGMLHLPFYVSLKYEPSMGIAERRATSPLPFSNLQDIFYLFSS